MFAKDPDDVYVDGDDVGDDADDDDVDDDDDDDDGDGDGDVWLLLLLPEPESKIRGDDGSGLFDSYGKDGL